MDALKSALPVLTFLLGCAFTLILKRLEARRDVRRNAAKELVRLAKEWHAQACDLHISADKISNVGGFDSFERQDAYQQALKNYLTYKKVLPDILLNIELIKNQRECAALVLSAQELLELVTNYQPDAQHDITACIPPKQDDVRLRSFIDSIEGCVSRIISSAAPILSR